MFIAFSDSIIPISSIKRIYKALRESNCHGIFVVFGNNDFALKEYYSSEEERDDKFDEIYKILLRITYGK